MIRVLVLAVVACGGDHPIARDANAPDGLPAITAPAEQWTWIPIDGMQCADGSPTGIGVNLTDRSDRVMVFFRGGGACWDGDSCFTTSAASHIVGGYGAAEFQSEIVPLGGGDYFFQRDDANPFRDASWVYVPYCTGDFQDGARVITYTVGGVDHVVHHVGSANVRALLTRVAATRPATDLVWMVGMSAGAYGVSFNAGAARAAWPDAHVYTLADSSPLIAMDQPRYETMQASWAMTFPPACTTCARDLGALPAALGAEMRADDRYGLLAYTHDQVMSNYLAITPDRLATEVVAEQTAMAGNQAAYLLDGTTHVLELAPSAQTTGGVVLSTWITQWATGDAAWRNAGP